MVNPSPTTGEQNLFFGDQSSMRILHGKEEEAGEEGEEEEGEGEGEEMEI